ncbi:MULTISPECIES: GtrA family protein [Chitinophagaceae]|uniref:GtrA family protein n=2 Tax=Chitinophagaceae TaxID=563835 RepID=A0ABU7RIJ4_9BACT
MRQLFYSARKLIIPVIDFFYPPFKKLMPLQAFRYLVCGSANTLFGLAVFYVAYHYIFREEDFNFRIYAFESYTAALIVSFTASFLFGFFLMKYIVFDDSKIKGHVQLFRYLLVCSFNLLLNYVLLKVAVEGLHIYPTFAQIGTTAIIIIVSYLAQRHFSFRKKKVFPDYVEEEDHSKSL